MHHHPRHRPPQAIPRSRTGLDRIYQDSSTRPVAIVYFETHMKHSVKTTDSGLRSSGKLQSVFIAVIVTTAVISARADAADVDVIARLHNADWRRVTPQSVGPLVGAGYQIRKSEDSPDRCSARYLVFRSDDTKSELRLRFDVTPSCTFYLSSVHLASDAEDAFNAEKLRLEIVSRLKPGGLPLDSGKPLRFLWRSQDSLTRFDLSLRVATDQHGSHMFARLDHDSVRPSDVDFLPFERGFMCPSAPESHLP